MRHTAPFGYPQDTTAGFLHRVPERFARAVHCFASFIPGNGISVSLHYPAGARAKRAGQSFSVYLLQVAGLLSVLSVTPHPIRALVWNRRIEKCVRGVPTEPSKGSPLLLGNARIDFILNRSSSAGRDRPFLKPAQFNQVIDSLLCLDCVGQIPPALGVNRA